MVNGVVSVELLFSAEKAEMEFLWLCGEYLMQTFVLSKRSVLPLFVESTLQASLLPFFFFLSRSFTYCCSFTLKIMFLFRVFWLCGIDWFWGFGLLWFLFRNVTLLFDWSWFWRLGSSCIGLLFSVSLPFWIVLDEGLCFRFFCKVKNERIIIMLRCRTWWFTGKWEKKIE